jgi:GH24 family phage-related lysozyme (muramidase)
MAVPPRVTPRRSEPTDLMKVTPSGRVNFQGQSVSAPPQVRASSAVQQPTPYVGKAASDKGLFMLAEGLQYFNAEIGKLAYTQRQQWEEGQVEKARTEAVTNPDKVAEVFRVGLDKAVEQGLFPRNAHPKYRFAYLEQGAKNMALSGLPAFLEEKARSLTTADSTEPIESTLNAYIDEYANTSGLTSSPIAYAAFREAAFPTTLRVAADTRKKREDNFNEARVEGLDQTISGLSRGLIEGLKLESDNDRLLAADASYRDLQTVYDSIRKDFPQIDATKQFTGAFVSGLNSAVNNGEIHPREAMMVLKDAAGKLKSGTGAWSDISDVQSALSGAYATWENKAIQLESINKNKVNQQNANFEEGVLNAFQEASDNGTFDSLNTSTDLDKIGRDIALKENPELVSDPVALRRKVRDLRLDFGETLENEQKYLQDVRWIEDEIINNPQGAAQLLRTMYDSRQITKATYDEYAKRSQDAADIGNYLNEGGFNTKLGNIEGLATSLVVPKGVQGAIMALSGDQTQKIVDLQTFGENVFRTTATELVSRKLNSDPTLRQPENATRRAGVVQEAVNEAYVETTKRISQEVEDSKDPKTAIREQEKAQEYGSMAQKVSVLEDAVNQLQFISPSGLTTPETVDFKVRIAKAPQELRYLAQQIGVATGEEKTRLNNAYQKMLSIVGYGPQAILSGKTEDGIEVPVADIKKNPMLTPIFRNEREYDAVVNEAKQGIIDAPAQTQNLISFIQDAEGFYEKAYWDNKQWSIGHGTRSFEGEVITKEEAAQRLNEEIASHAERIDAAQEEAGILLSEGQRNALISFDYNTGEGVSVIKRFGNNPEAMKQKMMEYINETKNGVKVKSKGLQNRRLKEIALFDSGDAVVAQPTDLNNTTLSKLMATLGIDTEKEIEQFLRQQKALSKQRSL